MNLKRMTSLRNYDIVYIEENRMAGNNGQIASLTDSTSNQPFGILGVPKSVPDPVFDPVFCFVFCYPCYPVIVIEALRGGGGTDSFVQFPLEKGSRKVYNYSTK